MLTHGNLVSNVARRLRGHAVHGRRRRRSRFLPLSHVFERMLDYAYLYRGASIAYAESIDKLAGQLPRGQPPLLRRRAARLREGPRADHGQGRGRAAPSRRSSSTGRSRVGQGEAWRYDERGEPVPAGARAQGEDRRQARLREDPQRARARASGSPSPAARRSPGTSPSSSRARASTIYEGYGLTETSPGHRRQRAADAGGWARSAGRSRASRSRSPPTARS